MEDEAQICEDQTRNIAHHGDEHISLPWALFEGEKPRNFGCLMDSVMKLNAITEISGLAIASG